MPVAQVCIHVEKSEIVFGVPTNPSFTSVFALGLFTSTGPWRMMPSLEGGVLRFATLPGEIWREFGHAIPSGSSQSNSRGPIFLESPHGLRFVTASGVNAPVELTVRDVTTGQSLFPALTHDRGVVSA